MTVKELFQMCRQYDIDGDSEIWLQPLLKDKARKSTTISLDNGRVIISASTAGGRKTGGRR